MLSDQERAEILMTAKHYPEAQAASIDALKVVQRHRGWVSDDVLGDVAELLGTSTTALEDLATFYNLIFRKPVGRHVILVCDSVSCWMMGYPAIRKSLKELLALDLGGTTADGRFTLLPNVCLGACDHAPVLMIDDDLYRDLGPQDLAGILERYP